MSINLSSTYLRFHFNICMHVFLQNISIYFFFLIKSINLEFNHTKKNLHPIFGQNRSTSAMKSP